MRKIKKPKKTPDNFTAAEARAAVRAAIRLRIKEIDS